MAGTRAASAPPVVRRYTRRTRWFHAATYLAVLVLLFTGWWLLAGGEGQPSPLARATGWADADIHTYAGWVAPALAALAVTLGARAARTFLAESVRVDRGDARWFVRWPAAVFTGRFPGTRDTSTRVSGSPTWCSSCCSPRSSAAAWGSP